MFVAEAMADLSVTLTIINYPPGPLLSIPSVCLLRKTRVSLWQSARKGMRKGLTDWMTSNNVLGVVPVPELAVYFTTRSMTWLIRYASV